MTTPAVIFSDVWKSYPSYNKVTGGIKSVLFNLPQTIKELRQRKNALEGISFEIKKGERFGFIGRNGAGKSTTLGLIAGILHADNGRVQVNGRISPLLELGAGFHPELTGRENILLNGVLMGLSKQEVQSHVEDIIDFSELREFIDQPIRTYSSGMHAKLGFAVVSQLKPEILLLDEVLSVGDIAFQEKCKRVFEEFKSNKDITIILVSHSIETVRDVCDRVVWIEDKKVKMIGETAQVLEAYLKQYNPKGKVTKHLRTSPLHAGLGIDALDCADSPIHFTPTISHAENTALRFSLWQKDSPTPCCQWDVQVQELCLQMQDDALILQDAQGNNIPTLENSYYPNTSQILYLSTQCIRNGHLEGPAIWTPCLASPESRAQFTQDTQEYWQEKAGEGLPPFIWDAGKTIHLVARNIVTKDAVGNCVMQMAATLRKYGIPCKVYAYVMHQELAGVVLPIGNLWRNCQPEDALFYHYSTEDEFLPALANLSCKKKILYYHNVTPGLWFREAMPDFADALDRTKEQYTYFEHFDAVAANSQFSLKEILQYLKDDVPTCAFPPTMKPRKLHEIQASPLSLPQEKHKILWVGRVAPHKRPELALQILQLLDKAHGNVALMMVISGRYDMPFMAEKLEKALSQIPENSRNKIHFYENISDGELAYLYENASLFLCTSGHEGYCLPVSEAVSMGVDVAYVPQEAVEETLAGKGTVLPENIVEASHKIYDLLMQKQQ